MNDLNNAFSSLHLASVSFGGTAAPLASASSASAGTAAKYEVAGKTLVWNRPVDDGHSVPASDSAVPHVAMPVVFKPAQLATSIPPTQPPIQRRAPKPKAPPKAQ